MALSEDQILRYSRQILLREVGGRGQERLLETAVEVAGTGAALATAVAYLLASGVRVLNAERAAQIEQPGFLVAGVAPEAVYSGQEATPTAIWLGQSPADVPEAPLARVLIGGSEMGAEVRFAPREASASVLRVGGPLGDVPPPLLDEVGALAALVVQRIALGLGDRGGRVRVDPAGTVRFDVSPHG